MLNLEENKGAFSPETKPQINDLIQSLDQDGN